MSEAEGVTSGSEAPVPTCVGIGIIRRAGWALARLRPRPPMPGVWEFPGGKCEPGESAEEATCRECQEEVGLAVRIVKLRRVIEHRYTHGFVRLHYYDCALCDENAEPRPETGFRWLRESDLESFAFPDANAPLLTELAQEARGAAGS